MDWRLTLIRLALAFGESVEDAVFKIDPGATLCLDRRRRCDRASAGTGI